jgi:hypothetical protein
MNRRLAKLLAIVVIALTWAVGTHYRSVVWLMASTLISEIALFMGSAKLIDEWYALLDSAHERRRRRAEKTERWHVRLARGFHTTVYVPIGSHGTGEGAIELAKTLADAQGVPWEGEFEPATGHGYGESHYLRRAEGGSWTSECKERIVEWLASR